VVPEWIFDTRICFVEHSRRIQIVVSLIPRFVVAFSRHTCMPGQPPTVHMRSFCSIVFTAAQSLMMLKNIRFMPAFLATTFACCRLSHFSLPMLYHRSPLTHPLTFFNLALPFHSYHACRGQPPHAFPSLLDTSYRAIRLACHSVPPQLANNSHLVPTQLAPIPFVRVGS
jgi:hypothetical protein